MINDRIKVLIDRLGVSPSKFSESIEVKATVIHNIIKARRSKPSFDILSRILEKYSDVSADWLLRGEGGIWRRKKSILKTAAKNISQVEHRTLELADILIQDNVDRVEAYELKEMLAILIDENHAAMRKLLKDKERQEEVIRTLMRLKQQL